MTDCPHGEVHPSACLECVEGVPDPIHKLSATRVIEARYPSDCARNPDHTVQIGQQVYYVPATGWCCGQCARPVEIATPAGDCIVWQGTGYYDRGVRAVETRTVVQLWCSVCGAVVELPPGTPSVETITDHRTRCPF